MISGVSKYGIVDNLPVVLTCGDDSVFDFKKKSECYQIVIKFQLVKRSPESILLK